MTPETLGNGHNKNAIVFCPKVNAYAKVVSFDKDKKEYTIKIRTKDDISTKDTSENKEQIVKAENVSQYVRIRIF